MQNNQCYSEMYHGDDYCDILRMIQAGIAVKVHETRNDTFFNKLIAFDRFSSATKIYIIIQSVLEFLV